HDSMVTAGGVLQTRVIVVCALDQQTPNELSQLSLFLPHQPRRRNARLAGPIVDRDNDFMHDFTAMRRDVLARHLRTHLQGEVRFDAPSRPLYSTDASIYQTEPLGVVIPRSVEDVVTTVQVCGETGVPITARGGGTSLSGQSIGPGIVLD